MSYVNYSIFCSVCAIIFAGGVNMKHEYILVKETATVRGQGSKISLSVEIDIVIPAKSSMVLSLPFLFTPVTPTVNYNFMVTLDWTAASKGLILGSWNIFSSTGESQDILNLMVYNSSDKTLTIPEGYDLVEVGLYSKIKFHAVKEDYIGSIVNLNLSKT